METSRSGNLAQFERELRLDEICDRFDTLWRSGQQPSIDDFLREVTEEERAELFQYLLAVELESRLGKGKHLVKGDYCARYPAYVAQIEFAFKKCSLTYNPSLWGRQAMDKGLPEQTTTDVVETINLPCVLGDYELLEKVGCGGMGSVYRARHRLLSKTVAVKVLPKERTLNPDVVARFQREMSAVGWLNHPNIVRAYDAREVGGTHFFVMEYVEGIHLDQLVRCYGVLGIADACEITRQAALELETRVKNGLVHRDIKPSNLMLSKEGGIKILDLGLARLRSNPGGASPPNPSPDGRVARGEGPGGPIIQGRLMGTVDYMRRNKRRIPMLPTSVRTFTVSVALCTNCSPGIRLLFRLSTIAGYKRWWATPVIRSRLFANPAGSTPDLATVLERMLAKEPDERPATPEAVAEATGRFAGGRSGGVGRACSVDFRRDGRV